MPSLIVAALTLGSLLSPTALASTSYGELTNFDAVVRCPDTSSGDRGRRYGLEIELHGVRSTEISYTYDWNHYGAPTIREDLSDLANPKTIVRYASRTKDAQGQWREYTNCEDPAHPISPTNGHMCTNPSVNEGCEHFGVGYLRAPTNVIYHWLDDDGTRGGPLALAEPLIVAAPKWAPVYQQPALPPGPANPIVEVVAVIPAPEVPDPEPVPRKFGEPSWVKVIKTTSHNNGDVRIEELVGKDGDGDGHDDWTNAEPDEVESEWYLLQDNPDGGAKAELAGAADELPDGNETVTRRYEFYAYTGTEATIDVETGEAMCDAVAVDDLHGVGTRGVTRPDPSHPGEVMTADVDCSQEAIVGEYLGAQMAAFDPAAALGLINRIEDGLLGEAYADRRVVIGGNSPYSTNVAAGSLPAGLLLDSATGVLSGTPTLAGASSFTVSVTDASGNTASRPYTIVVVDPSAPPDLTPRISPTVTGTLGQAGWYTSNVQISWDVDTRNQAVTTPEAGCSTVTLSQDTSAAGIRYTCSVATTAGPAEQSVTIYRDATRPVASAVASPVAASGWNSTNVTVHFSGTDAASGVASCSADVTVSAEGAAQQSASGACTDAAGLSSTAASVSGINIDKTAPTVTASAAPAPNGAGWNTSAVTVSFSGTDALSGVALDGCDAPVVLSNSSASGQSATGACHDRAGNSSNATASNIRIDLIAPTATATVTPAANAAGWHKVPATVSFSGTDGLSGSGVAGCTASSTISVDTSGQTVSGTCSDVAGNSSASASATVKLDQVLPIVTITVPASNATYTQGSSVATAYACSDARSTVQSCSGTVAAGASLNTATTGTKTFSVTAFDYAGNTRTSTVSYSVVAGTPAYSVAPTSLAFGNQALNLESATQSITLSSTGTAALPITSIALSGTSASQFVLKVHTCGTSVAAGATCTITVAFKPTSKGTKSASVTVTAGGSAGTKSVALSGTGVISVYTVSATSLAFGSVKINTTSTAKSVTISNTGTVVLPITSIKLSGTSANQFAIASNTCPAQVAVGANCTVAVVFKPTATGTKSGTLVITPGGGATAKSLALTGTGAL